MINIAEILSKAPKGMGLYSTVMGSLSFDKIQSSQEHPIQCRDTQDKRVTFDKHGRYYSGEGECTLFPSKDQRDWSKFILFEEGEFYSKEGDIFIHKKFKDDDDQRATFLCAITCSGRFDLNEKGYARFGEGYAKVSDEEKNILLKAISDNGYVFDPESVTLKKKQHTFKAFDQVLVRDNVNYKWKPTLYSYFDESDIHYPHVCISCRYKFCIPYEGNEHLVETSNNIK